MQETKNKRLKLHNLCVAGSFCAILCHQFTSSIFYAIFFCHLCLLFVFHQIFILHTLKFAGRCTSSSFVFMSTIILFALFIECVFIVFFTSTVCTQLHKSSLVFYINSLQQLFAKLINVSQCDGHGQWTCWFSCFVDIVATRFLFSHWNAFF
jgi:hypothetical protein